VRRIHTPAIATLLLISAAACSLAEDESPATARQAEVIGGGSASATQEAPPGEGSDRGRRIDPRRRGLDVGFGEFAITLEADEIRPGHVTFVIRNGGALVHGFEIEAEDDDGDNSGSGNGELKLEGPEFGPGDTVRISADLPPGVYELECFVGDHDDRGMRATLVVRAGAPLVRQGSPVGSDAVLVTGFAFDPAAVQIDAGDALTWTNEDPTAHTVTADDGSFDSGTMDPGGTFSHRFDEPGTYLYSCAIHPAMRATVRVA
jgi:plastocyanin